MIDEDRTIQLYGYNSDDLSRGSGRPIIAVCEECGDNRVIQKRAYTDLCRLCALRSDETRSKISKSRTGKCVGKDHPKFGKHPSEETLKKQSESHIGLHLGKDNPMYGKKHTLEAIQKMRISHEGQVGENASNWQGGITSENDKFRNSINYVIWRTSVFERDDYTCQDCMQTGLILNAHHILPYSDWKDPKISLNINNGITLCEDCHRSIKGNEYDYANNYFNITFNKMEIK